MNEVPLRHLIQKLDEKTAGPKGFTGEIAKQLETCENLDLINFHPIKYNFSSKCGVEIDLSQDQAYLLIMVQRIECGDISKSYSLSICVFQVENHAVI